MSFNHPQGGQAKFLKQAIDEAQGSYLQDVGKLTQSNFEAKRGIRSVPRVEPTRPKDPGGR